MKIAIFAGMKVVFYILSLICVALIQTSCNTHKHIPSSQDKIGESEVFYEPEQQPYYLHGDTKGLLNDLYATILETAPATQEFVKARAIVRFDISEYGQIDSTSIKVIRNNSVPEDYLRAAIDAIKKLGKFEPGKMNGIPKKVTWNLPIIYPVPLEHIIIKTKPDSLTSQGLPGINTAKVVLSFD